jgi:hypothetical protein
MIVWTEVVFILQIVKQDVMASLQTVLQSLSDVLTLAVSTQNM